MISAYDSAKIMSTGHKVPLDGLDDYTVPSEFLIFYVAICILPLALLLIVDLYKFHT